jgi:prefoldin alpha subunit
MKKHKDAAPEHEHSANEDETRALFESQMIQAHIAELEKQLSEIEAKKAELDYIKESLVQIKDQCDKEIVFPLGSGILAYGKLIDCKKVIVNVGANVLVEKEIPEAREIINDQITELDSVRKIIDQEIQKYLMHGH